MSMSCSDIIKFLYDKVAEFNKQPYDPIVIELVEIIRERFQMNHSIIISYYGTDKWQEWAIEDEDSYEVLIDEETLKNYFEE